MNGRGVWSLVGLTVAVVLGVLGVMAWDLARADGALAREGVRSSIMIECEAGAEVVQIGGGRIRIIGECGLVGGGESLEPVRPDGEVEVGPVYEYAYPVPDEVYPEPYNRCDRDWAYGQVCEP